LPDPDRASAPPPDRRTPVADSPPPAARSGGRRLSAGALPARGLPLLGGARLPGGDPPGAPSQPPRAPGRVPGGGHPPFAPPLDALHGLPGLRALRSALAGGLRPRAARHLPRAGALPRRLPGPQLRQEGSASGERARMTASASARPMPYMVSLA